MKKKSDDELIKALGNPLLMRLRKSAMLDFIDHYAYDTFDNDKEREKERKKMFKFMDKLIKDTIIIGMN